MASSCPVVATLSFAQYLRGADRLLTDEQLPGALAEAGAPDGDNVLEVTQELAQFFDHEFSDGLLQRGLLVLAPRIVLLANPATRTCPARTDRPFLRDADLDELFSWCELQQYPTRPSLLEHLLPIVAR